MRPIFSPLSILLLLLATAAVYSQDRCFTPEEAAKAIASVDSPTTPADIQKIRKELLNMRQRHEKLNSEILGDFSKNQSRVPEVNALGRNDLLRVCEIIRNDGWPDKTALKPDGYDALVFLITSNKAVELQRETFPVLVAASKKDEFPKSSVAEVADSIRLGYGLPQIFGTQATRRGDIIYILPLLNDARVDEWRKIYDLQPLAQQIRGIERRYLLPVLKSQKLSSAVKPNSPGIADVAQLGISDTDEAIKVETNVVNLNVRLMAQKGATLPPNLSKDDFVVTEDGVQQDIAYFSNISTPFDLVLVLDFSGSTADKRKLIKDAAKRLVDVARPEDRIAVVSFGDEITTESPLTLDKAALADRISKINADGSSPVWDSLSYTFTNVLKPEPGRRSAIVFMTDGDDTASKITFADAMEQVRHHDTMVYSVFINTVSAEPSQKDYAGRLVGKLEATLQMLADETGGQFYAARQLKDLNGIYEQIVQDVGSIYSVGYEPKNDRRDGGWRSVEVKIKDRPDVTAKTRRGYYAN